MLRGMVCRAAMTAAVVFLVAWTSAVAEENKAAEDAALCPPKDATGTPEAKAEDDREWQVFFGAVNLWPKLDESEGKIDKLINNGLGSLFPRWEEPRTFKDWRDDLMLWDFQIGVAREVNEKWDYYFAIGAVYGHQPNSDEYYPLAIPLTVKSEFTRSLWFTSAGIDYFPWGKAEMPEGAGHGIVERLKAAKPYAELFVTYIDLKGHAEVSLNLPQIGEFFHYQDKARYDLIGIGPRLGIDIPITDRDSVSFTVNPLIFTSHQREFDSICFGSFIRHRF